MWEHGPRDRAGFHPSILRARFWVLTCFWGESGGAIHLCQLCTLLRVPTTAVASVLRHWTPRPGSHPPGPSVGCPLTRDPQTRVSPSWAVCRVSPDPRPPDPGLTLLGHLQGGQSRKQGVP